MWPWAQNVLRSVFFKASPSICIIYTRGSARSQRPLSDLLKLPLIKLFTDRGAFGPSHRRISNESSFSTQVQSFLGPRPSSVEKRTNRPSMRGSEKWIYPRATHERPSQAQMNAEAFTFFITPPLATEGWMQRQTSVGLKLM